MSISVDGSAGNAVIPSLPPIALIIGKCHLISPSTCRLINFWKEEWERQRWWDGESWHLSPTLLAGLFHWAHRCGIKWLCVWRLNAKGGWAWPCSACGWITPEVQTCPFHVASFCFQTRGNTSPLLSGSALKSVYGCMCLTLSLKPLLHVQSIPDVFRNISVT